MADHKNGMLDDIPDEPEAAPAAEAPEIEAQAPEPQAEQPEGQEGDRPKRGPASDPNRPEGFVPKQALQAERARADLYEDRFNKVVEKFFKQAEPEQVDDGTPRDPGPPPQDPNDYVGFLEWQRSKLAFDDHKRAEWQQQEKAQQEFNDTLNRARTRFQKVAAERPEVADLYSAVQNKVGEYYASQGVPMHQIPELITRYEAEVIKWARQEYIPIEEALEQAAAKFGIAPPQRQAAAKPTPERDPQTGQFLPSEAEKAAKVRESQERNASLSSAPGSPVKKMGGKELAMLPEEEMWRHFDSVGRKPGAKQFDREMGFR